MEALIVPRVPSPCSITSLAGESDDMVSLPSTEIENKTTTAPPSEPRSLVTPTNDSLENCTYGLGKKCHAKANEQHSVLEHGRDPNEEPKLVWTKSRKRAFLHFLLLHSVPVSITVVLFSLYLHNFQWSANDIQLKALLFAAKLHESLIVISLADILFHRIRYHLLTDRGISFGLLVAPFRVSSPLSLFQAPFLASARFTLKTGPELVTILLVVLVSVLALLAGPSSAALMLPRYDWWQVPEGNDYLNRFKKQDLETAAYIGAPFEDLYPLLIDGGFSPDAVRDSGLDKVTLSDRMRQMIFGVEGALVGGASAANGNITVVDGVAVDSFGLAYQEKSLENCTITAQDISEDQTLDEFCRSVAVQATSPLAVVTKNLFNRYQTWKSASSSLFMIAAQALGPNKTDLTWRQPTVSMQCSVAPPDLTQKPITFPRWGASSPLHVYPDQQLREQITKARSGSPESPVAYVDIGHLIPPGNNVSTALLLNFDKVRYNMFSSTTHLCLLDARWIDSHVWFTAPFPTIMRSGASMEDVQAIAGSNRAATTGPTINITAEYANSLDSNLTVLSSYAISPKYYPTEDSPFGLINTACAATVTEGLQIKCSLLGHALYLTDSLRRTQSLFGYRTAKELQDAKGVTLLDPGRWTKLDYRLYRQSHAYKFEGPIIKLSMSVLLMHMMLVYAHLLLLLLGDGWCSRAWSELGELITLAILTRPSPLLRNAGGGVNNSQTWNLRAFVRETTPEGSLELVLKETAGSPSALVGLEEEREEYLVKPEADRRYG